MDYSHSGCFYIIVYTHSSDKYTHKFVSKEQKGINGAEIKNADGNACGSVKEIYDYDHWGRITSKTDADGQKTRIQYTPFGQVSQVFPAAADQPATGDIVLKKFRYNKWGELEEANTYDGNGTTSACVRKTECFTNDSFGRVLTRSIPQAGYEERYLYEEVFVDSTDGKNTIGSRKRSEETALHWTW